ncbi:MAG TPA: fibronectin type III domain-containing protein [Candidatus Eisenbacteria bacterium]
MHRCRFVPYPIDRRRSASWRAACLSLAIASAILSSLLPRFAHAQTSPDSSVVLQWTAPGDDGNTGRATSYDLRYRTVSVSGTDTLSWWNSATQVSGEPVPGTAGSTDSLRVRGLTPLTTYYFIIRAADEVPNWSGYSNVASKTTTGDTTPPAAITTLAITGTTGSSIALRWTATGNNGTTGTASTYDIRYSTSPITSTNWGSASQATGEPAPAVAGTQQVFTLSGLPGSQTYYVAIRASDGSGNQSALSNVVSGTTADSVAPAAVRDLSLLGLPAGEPMALAPIHAEVDRPRVA